MGTYSYDDRSYGNAYIDALVDGRRWQVGDTVRYYLDPIGGTAPGEDGIPGVWKQAGAADALLSAMSAWNAVANIHLVLTNTFTGADYKESIYQEQPDPDTGLETLGEHYLPNDEQLGGKFNSAADVFTSEDNAKGGYNYVTFLHELGHSIGLDHPFDGDQVFPGVTPGDDQDSGDHQLNSQLYTVMTYTDLMGSVGMPPSFEYGWAGTPMAFDIAAAQALYGANMSTNKGDTTYLLPSTNSPGTYFSCIWDAGGTDIISGRNTDGCSINLESATLKDDYDGGGFVSSGTGRSEIYGGFTIAHGVTIENALGSSGNDSITGNDADNRIDGAGGDDRLAGGGGADTFVIDVSKQYETILDFQTGIDHLDISALRPTYAVAIDTASHGTGLEFFDAHGVLADVGSTQHLQAIDMPNIPIQFQFDHVDGTWTGGSLEDRLTGQGHDDALFGGAANDTLTGAGGNDKLGGDDGADALSGGSGNDVLDGGAGADTMNGGTGNDNYSVDNVADKIAGESAGYGTDTVMSSLASYTLGDQLENLTLTGAALNGTGNGLANVIAGNGQANNLFGGGGADRLIGGAGNDILNGDVNADTMIGGTGNDSYYVQNSADVVTEKAGEGTDTLTTFLQDYTLPTNVENLFLGSNVSNGNGNGAGNVVTGNDRDNSIFGGGGADTLYGDAGNDILNGDVNADTMIGGTGNDSYYVQNSADIVTEKAGEGTDTITTFLQDYTLGANVENLMLGGNVYNGNGNALANVITGNDRANHLFGGDAADTLTGGAGDDRLDGGAGADKMAGGIGNDTYLVQDAHDAVTEKQGQGTDTVICSLASYVMPDNVEDLTLTGSSATAIGNALGNVIVGTNGKDHLTGGAGQDVLTGGGGSDTFIFGANDFAGTTSGTADRITDWSGGDRIDLSAVHAGGKALHFTAASAFDGKAGDLIVTQSSANTFVHIDLDGDKHTDLLIKLEGLHTLTASAFIL